jgi:hypothetical protein
MGKPSIAWCQPDRTAAVLRHAPRWVFAAAVLFGAVEPAAADAIDGNWCFTDGRRLSIHGPEIVTPGGNRLAGNYGRHDFSYTAPSSESAGGQTVFMLLVNENTMRLKVGSAPSYSDPAEVWTRCGPSIS